MSIHEEPDGYERGAFSDLRGAWENLQEAIAQADPFPNLDRVLLHVDEGMSWESVRDLDRMHKALVLVRNLATPSGNEDVAFWIEQVRNNMDEVMAGIARGERL